MEIHSQYGVCAPEVGWIPSPRYLMRRHRILRWLAHAQRGPLLEVGCGAGALLFDLQARGFACTAHEPSAEARAVVRQIHAGEVPFALFAEPQPDWNVAFRYVLACEVLEHIDDDRAALLAWRRYLPPQGRLILSVPAGPNRWGEVDTWAGHVRRYDRAGLTARLADSGLRVVRMETYGFPVANVLEHVRNFRLRRQGIGREASRSDCRSRDTARSGIERSELQGLYRLYRSALVSRSVMPVITRLQALSSSTDLGNGLLVMAEPAV